MDGHIRFLQFYCKIRIINKQGNKNTEKKRQILSRGLTSPYQVDACHTAILVASTFLAFGWKLLSLQLLFRFFFPFLRFQLCVLSIFLFTFRYAWHNLIKSLITAYLLKHVSQLLSCPRFFSAVASASVLISRSEDQKS
jgi:hypothetical protein